MSTAKNLTSRVIETKPLKWNDFKFIQDSNFKDLSAEASDKLRKSILENQFTQPFYVWNEPETGINYCLDGYHRVKELKVLVELGHSIPEELPATLIRCEDKKEAAKLVLIYSSMYAKVTEEGFKNFIEFFDLDLESLSTTIDLPGMPQSIENTK